jgi:hypothetical protein
MFLNKTDIFQKLPNVKTALCYLPIIVVLSEAFLLSLYFLQNKRPFKSTTTSSVTAHHSVSETALLKKLRINTSVAHCHQHKR